MAPDELTQVVLEQRHRIDQLGERHRLVVPAPSEFHVMPLDACLGLVADPVTEVRVQVVQPVLQVRFGDPREGRGAGVGPQVMEDHLHQLLGVGFDEPNQTGSEHVAPPILAATITERSRPFNETSPSMRSGARGSSPGVSSRSGAPWPTSLVVH
jgi:hypothetical protein